MAKPDQSDIDSLLAEFEAAGAGSDNSSNQSDDIDIDALLQEVDAAEQQPPAQAPKAAAKATPKPAKVAPATKQAAPAPKAAAPSKEPEPDLPLPDEHAEILQSVCHLEDAPSKKKSDGGVLLPEPDHRIIDSLDEITTETEIKTNEVMDKLDAAIEKVNTMVTDIDRFSKLLDRHERVVEMLSHKHPDNPVVKFLRDFSETLDQIEQIKKTAQECQDDIYVAMDLLQFQDISRQKIEKVIAVIRALNGYLNTWFGTSRPDSSRASVAKTFGKEDVQATTDEDIEALIGEFQEKN